MGKNLRDFTKEDGDLVIRRIRRWGYDPMAVLLALVTDMGWGVVVDESDERVTGLVIGTPAFLEEHLKESPHA